MNLKKSFLINLYKAFVFIRSDIQRFENKKIIGALINIFSNSTDYDVYIKALPIDFSIVSCEIDVEVYMPESFREIFLYTLKKLNNLLNNMLYEEAYDLVDAVHGLPELIALQRTQNLEDFWDIYIEPIQCKWNIEYLQEFKAVFVNNIYK